MRKPQLSYSQIWNMCFGFLGIQIGFDLQNSNMSRIFQTLGADYQNIAILWIAAPLTGLIVQPIIGHLSDKTWMPSLGRRRPYFLIGAILASLSLVIMPHAPALWFAAGMLWILDASLNITMEPTRAFVGDNLPDEQRTTGYAMQSFFIGVGAVIAGMLPWALTTWFGVSNTAAEGEIPMTVRIAFYFGGLMLFLAIMWTVFFSREYSPDQMEKFEAARREALGEDAVLPEAPREAGAFFTGGVAWLAGGVAIAALFYAIREGVIPGAMDIVPVSKEAYVLAGLVAAFGVIQLVAGQLSGAGKTQNGFMEIVTDLFRMPVTMRQLAFVQFFTWFGLFAMWIYGTQAVTEYHYGTNDPTTAAYNEAANWWALLGGIRNGVAAAAALVIMWLAYKMDRRQLHALCLGLGVLGFAATFVLPGSLLWISMIGVGIGWASIVSVPYAILSGSVPAARMGIYMGIFNIFIVVPQLLAATLLGTIVLAFNNQPIVAFAIAAISWTIAAIGVLFVRDVPEDLGVDALAEPAE
ncbi:MAG: MFS transporter [Pseudomonadota bacterium]